MRTNRETWKIVNTKKKKKITWIERKNFHKIIERKLIEWWILKELGRSKIRINESDRLIPFWILKQKMKYNNSNNNNNNNNDS